MDRQMKRRLKRVRSHEASRAITREKNLANIQFKILDVFRPLLYSWALIGSGEASEKNPLYAAVVCAIKLLGHCFNYLSGQRRSNILKVTDPEYEDVANDQELLDPRELAHLFGKKFLRNLAQEVDDDQKLEKAMGRPGTSANHSGRNRRREYGSLSGGNGFSFGGSGLRRKYSGLHRNIRRSVISPPSNNAECFPSRTTSGNLFGGRISRFISFWRSFTNDCWVLSAVEHGVSIPFLQYPSVPFRKFNLVSGEATRVCDGEIRGLLSKGVIEEIPRSEAHFVCGIFVIPKSSGGFRMIVNLRPINQFIQHKHFKMESLSLLRDLLRKGDYFCKIDLTDAYLTIPLRAQDQICTSNFLGVGNFSISHLLLWAFDCTMGVYEIA